MQVLNLDSGKYEKKDDMVFEDFSENIRTEIRDLAFRIGMVTKKQLWEYFSDVPDSEVSRNINKLVRDKELYKVNDTDKYVVDERLLLPEYFKAPKSHGIENNFANIEKFKSHISALETQCMAFWVFLDFKKAKGAQFPMLIENHDFPFVIMAFSANDTIYEILYIGKGKEMQLAMLSTKERYDSDFNKMNQHRILMLDDMSQKADLGIYQIAGVEFYVTVNEDGKTHYEM